MLCSAKTMNVVDYFAMDVQVQEAFTRIGGSRTKKKKPPKVLTVYYIDKHLRNMTIKLKLSI